MFYSQQYSAEFVAAFMAGLWNTTKVPVSPQCLDSIICFFHSTCRPGPVKITSPNTKRDPWNIQLTPLNHIGIADVFTLSKTLVFLQFLLFLPHDPALLGDHHTTPFLSTLFTTTVAGRHQLFVILVLDVPQDLSSVISQMFLYTIAATLLCCSSYSLHSIKEQKGKFRFLAVL